MALSPSSDIDHHPSKRRRLHSTYYSSFFLLRTEVLLNGQPAEIGCSDDKELTLHCRGNTEASVAFPAISAKIEEIFKRHGVCDIGNFFPEESPQYQVSFDSAPYVEKFLKEKSNVEDEMAALLSQSLPEQAEKARVTATLILVNRQETNTNPIEVTQENFNTCMAIWRGSAVFEFQDVLRLYQQNQKKEGEVQLTSVLRELIDVSEWKSLGIFLGFSRNDLETIKLDCLNDNKNCKEKMVDGWIKRGKASWAGLVRALCDIGSRRLAKKIAYKFGTILPPAIQTSDQELLATERGRLLSYITQCDQRLADQTVSTEKATQTKVEASETHDHVKRSFSAALERVKRLRQEWNTLNEQLAEKEKRLQILQSSETQLQSEVDRLKQEIKQLKNQLDQKDKELADVSAEANDLKVKLEKATAELEKAIQERNKLEAEGLKGDLDKKRREFDKVQCQSELRKERIDELKGELATKATESEKKEREIGALGKEIEMLKQQQANPAVILQQQMLLALETSDLKVKLAIAEERRQEAGRQLQDIQRQAQLLSPAADDSQDGGSSADDYQDGGSSADDYQDDGSSADDYQDGGSSADDYQDDGSSADDYQDGGSSADEHN